MASSTSGFQLVYDVVSNSKIPVSLYRSKDTQLSVAIAHIEGPLVNGYFCLATEAHDDDGLPHTLEHLVFLGSKDYPYKGVLDLLANRCLASGTNAWTDTDHTCYTMTTAGSQGFLQLLPIYVDHILHPTLKESGFVTEVHHITGEGEDAGVVYCEMQGRENKGESLTHLAMLRAMYPGHCGYKSETGGIMANLRDSTTHDKVVRYHEEFYRPENLCLIITGDVDAQEVFKALKPVEDKIKAKGLQASFSRPWQCAVPPLPASVHEVVRYPTDDEQYGMVTVAWRGPPAKDQYQFEALNILLDYLSDSTISPIVRDFVEIEEPFCSQVSQFTIENSQCCFGFNFQNVDSKFLKDIAPKLNELLKSIAEGKEKVNMDRMNTLLHRAVLDALNTLEDDNHDAVACMIIGQFLYGDSQEEFSERLNTISCRQRLKEEGEEFWLGLLRTLTQGCSQVVIIGEPSSALMEEKGKEEKERVKAQREKLGAEGLAKCGSILEEATAANEVEPPESLLTSVAVPSADSIHFHHLTPYCNRPAGSPGQQHPAFPLSDIPYRFQLDHINTNFARMMVIMDTSSLPLSLKYYLPLLTEALMESAILRNGELIPHETVIAELEKDTQSSDRGLGLPPGCFECGHFPQYLLAEVKVEEEKYQRGVQWLHDVLYGTHFTADRLKIIANRKIGDISSLKRSGSRIARTLLQNLVFAKDCNYNVSSMLRQSAFLTSLLQRLDTAPQQVEEDLKKIRESLLQPHNVRVHLSCDVEKLAARCSPAAVWKTFLSDNNQDMGDGDAAVPKMREWILPLASSPYQKVIVGVGDVESAFFQQVVPSISSYHDPELPALMVLIQYLVQCEGPMWCQIRGLGLAYGYSMIIRPDLGLLYLSLTKSAQLVEAYDVGQKIVQEYLSGETEFSEVELESARSSLIFEIIEEEKTVWDAAQESVLSYFRGVDHDYNRQLVRKVSEVTVENLKTVGQKYLRPLFDAKVTRCAACVHPSKVTEVSQGFSKLGVKLTTISSLDEQFLVSL